jgi:hypothetical protein
MVKQLRLTTTDNQGIFQCWFEEDITIAPHSKIALQCFSSQFPSSYVTIDSQNDEIIYTCDGETNKKSIFLPHGTYTTATVENLFVQTTKLLNESMEYNEHQLGKQWRVGTDGSRTNFQLTKGTLLESNLDDQYLCKARNVQEKQEGGFFGFARDGGVPLQDDSYFWFNSTQCKGSSTFRTEFLFDSAPETGGGFQVCYLNQAVNANTGAIHPSLIAYGIRYVQGDVDYSKTINGVTEPVIGVLPIQGDNLIIDTYEGNIYLNIERASDGSIVNLFTGPYDHTTNYYPVTIFVGADCILAPSFFCSDPYYNVLNPENLGVYPNLPSNVPTQNFFQIVSRDLATIFGFLEQRYPTTGYILSKDVSYIAELPFRLRDYSETYCIELLDLPLLSYDALTHKRRSIIAVVPSLQEIREHVIYTANQLIYLDLNNTYPISLRELRAVVLRDDLSSITTYGLSQMVLLIKGENEV